MNQRLFIMLLAGSVLGFGCAQPPVTLECASERDCEDGNSCTDNPCNNASDDPSDWGCEDATVLVDGTVCDIEFGSAAQDGFCGSGICVAERCTVENAPVACGDENQCTVDSCDVSGEASCVNDAAAAFDATCDFNGTGVCDGEGVCGDCNDNDDCTADPDKGLCQTEASPRVCVECLSSLDCVEHPDGENCNVVTKECDPGCESDNDCSAEPVRDRCFLPGGGLGSCVECLSSADCSGETPFCESNQCTAQPTFRGTIIVDCAALASPISPGLAVNDIRVVVEAIPQGPVTAGQPVEIVFNVVETALDFPILGAFEGCPIDVLQDDIEQEPGMPLEGEIRLESVSGGSGNVIARTVNQSLPIVNPLSIPDIATGTGTFTPEVGATTLSIGLDSIKMHLVAPANPNGCAGELLTPVDCPCADLASPPNMCGLDEPTGTIDIPIDN